MSGTTRRGTLAAAAIIASLVIPTGSIASGPHEPNDFTATTIAAANRFSVAKSASGSVAESDPSLLGRTDAAIISVMVKLDYDATASYTGDIVGLDATSPRVTGRDLTGVSPAERRYEAYTSSIDGQFRADARRAVPAARVGSSFLRVYGGVSMQLPANQIDALLDLPNVAAVQVDELNELQTDSSNEFIGSPTIWAQDGGQDLAGQGVIFGDLDSGVWPEHPSLADNAALGTPPAKEDATARDCDFGDNPLTAEVDVFVCNSKLIGGEAFIDTYNAVVGGDVYPDSARDSNGHGTHTTTTAAGNVVPSATIFGVERGPVSGVAPGAWVISYKVCGLQGCFSSDTAAAVQQAIIDGVDVINFSISGGSNPFSDPTELAFLDAYNAGITVAASAGNAGPGAGTTDHRSPWVITVAASTQTRAFQSTITLNSGADTLNLVGSSITQGIATETPVVLAESIPGYEAFCLTELPAGVATGVIVACARGVNGRVQKGYNVLQGGAAGMILYNPALQDTETDTHWLPAVHLAVGTDFLAFMAAHPGGVTATFTDGTSADGAGDVMAGFSSRGPGGLFLKPDITAPGVQILAGHTPTPDEIATGPAGQYFQAIAGTSMSAPHIAGAAILLQGLHPEWTPGAIKSALMTTALTDVLKENEVTPADPFDFGAGRVDLTRAGATSVVFDDTSTNMALLGNDPLAAMNLNLPSVNIPVMPGSVTVTRTATNVTGRNFVFKAAATAPDGSEIVVTPRRGVIRPGQSQTFEIRISSSAPTGQYFGEITLTGARTPALHLPVAFFNQQGAVTLEQSCDPTTIKIGGLSTCTVTATNNSFDEASVTATTTVTKGLQIVGGPATVGPTTLAGKKDAIPSINAGLGPAGYLPLSLFGIPPQPIGDEQVINYNVPALVFGGKTYTSIGVVSNGYVVLGGGDGGDVDYVPQTLPDPAAPNGVLAPYWSDLDGNGAPGIYIGSLTDGVNSWVVVEWDVVLWGTTDHRKMQIWIGVDGVEDVSYAYDAATTLGQGTPAGYGLTVGAENESGTAGAQLAGPPTSEYVISTTPGAPGGSLAYDVTVKGKSKGGQLVKTTMTGDTVAGLTVASTAITVNKR